MRVVLEDALVTLGDLMDCGEAVTWGGVTLRQKSNSHTNARTMSLPPREMIITSSDCKRRDEIARPKKKNKSL
jgi:hypothetical protein